MKSTSAKKTIRVKLFMAFFLSIVLLIGVSIFLNAFFLESFYIKKNKVFFEETRNHVLDVYTQNQKTVESFIEQYGKRNEITIEISNDKLKLEYSSIAKGQHGDELPKEIKELIVSSMKQLNESPVYETVTNEKHEVDNPRLVYVSSFNNGHYLVLTKPLNGIRESVQITNQFTLLTGGIIIVLGGLITLVISIRATKPILEMNRVARQIADLNFEESLEVTSEDEIGMLGHSINSISEKLGSSIDALKMDIDRRKQLVRDISHELKTPIGVIKGYSEGLIYDVADTPEMKKQYLETIVNECNQMDHMVKEMIELSSYEYNEKHYEITDIQVGLIVDTLMERFSPIIEKYGLVFGVNGDRNAVVQGDFNLVVRGLSNFLTNAVRHVNDHGQIALHVETTDTESHLSVMNTGSSIPENEMNKIWDVFYKVDETRSRTGVSGSGLGLSIVKQIAELHRGRVSVSNIENGVKFSLILPRNFT